MNIESRKLILQFMRLTLGQFHPDFDEYPIDDMKRVEGSNGKKFKGTEYEHKAALLQAYYMHQAIEGLEND
ncbi:hypothetical protein ACFLXQ_06675 [Chloroflexota bacterium]